MAISAHVQHVHAEGNVLLDPDITTVFLSKGTLMAAAEVSFGTGTSAMEVTAAGEAVNTAGMKPCSWQRAAAVVQLDEGINATSSDEDTPVASASCLIVGLDTTAGARRRRDGGGSSRGSCRDGE